MGSIIQWAIFGRFFLITRWNKTGVVLFKQNVLKKHVLLSPSRGFQKSAVTDSQAINGAAPIT